MLFKATYKKTCSSIWEHRESCNITGLDYTLKHKKKNNDRALKSGVKLSFCHIHILQNLSQGSGYRVRYASDRLPKVWGWRKIPDPPDEAWVVQPRRIRPSARRQRTAGKKQLDRQQPAGVCCFPAVPRTDTVDKTRKGRTRWIPHSVNAIWCWCAGLNFQMKIAIITIT